MPIDILFVVIATTMIQSIFGVGVLLFGTPLLLLFGHNFFNALQILLPISIVINLLQLSKHYRLMDSDFVKNVLVYSVPFIVCFLFLLSLGKIHIGLIIGSFLILVALKDIFPPIKQTLHWLVTYEKIYLIVMGIIHGLTNLGGSLLTAIVHSKSYSKNEARATIAGCYSLFASFQLASLWIFHPAEQIHYADKLGLLLIAVIVSVFIEKIVYEELNNQRYVKLFASFLISSGLLLIWKALYLNS
jgi:uncharacterized membrane protein YfcA